MLKFIFSIKNLKDLTGRGKSILKNPNKFTKPKLKSLLLALQPEAVNGRENALSYKASCSLCKTA